MASHDFSTDAEKQIDTKQAYKKQLSQQAGQIVSQLANFKGTYDTLYAMCNAEEQAFLDSKFQAFKLDAKNALGL